VSITISQLVEDLQTEKTVLLFGSGSSVPSGSPKTEDIMSHLSSTFGLSASGFTLPEISGIIEKKTSRKRLISELRTLFSRVKPTRGLLNLPLYEWRSIFTTNYDTLIEQAYSAAKKEMIVYSSNFDFTTHDAATATKLFKLHGTIDKDISDGHISRIILTDLDYDQTNEYRDALFDRLKSDLAGARLIIVGHSLSDPDVREIINRAARINVTSQTAGQIAVLLYSRDEDRAVLFEARGIKVCFGGIDDFFAALALLPIQGTPALTGGSPLDEAPELRPITVDVAHEAIPERAHAAAMFNGWPATYADIVAGSTFERSVAANIVQALTDDGLASVVLLGASGVGKTTAARQAVERLRKRGLFAWEHNGDYPLLTFAWLRLASRLKERGDVGVLFVDEAHSHLPEINELVDGLTAGDNDHLKLVLVSSRNRWSPRVKSAGLFKRGKGFHLSKLDDGEIEQLLNLIDISPAIGALVEGSFSGFSRQERRRRLRDRCEADMFVCLKNIFASDNFDDIILREFASLDDETQDVYRYVAAMETAGVRVHRQLLIRLLGISAVSISGLLSNLADIVNEYTISEREGLYAWTVRHAVIAAIVSKYKFHDTSEIIRLFEKVIDAISPTYEIEIRTVRELCNIDTGLPRIPDREVQNRLLRRMMSVAPGERVPRHRLIRNLIKMDAFEKAETEIRIFEKDFGVDGPVFRYKVNLMVARAARARGILEEDRVAILEQARDLAKVGVERFPYYHNMMAAYADLGIEYFRKTGKYDIYDDAIAKLKAAEDRLGDPEISRVIARCARLMAGQSYETADQLGQ